MDCSQDQMVMMQVFAGAFMQAMNSINSQSQIALPLQQGRIENVVEGDMIESNELVNERSLRSNGQHAGTNPGSRRQTRQRAREVLEEISREGSAATRSDTTPDNDANIMEAASNASTCLRQAGSTHEFEGAAATTQNRGACAQFTLINNRASFFQSVEVMEDTASGASFPAVAIRSKSDTESELSSVPSSHRARSESMGLDAEPTIQAPNTNAQSTIFPTEGNIASQAPIPSAATSQNPGVVDKSGAPSDFQSVPTQHVWKPIPVRPQRQFPSHDGLPSFYSTPAMPSRRTEKAPIIVISDSEDNDSNTQRRRTANDNRSLDAQFYAAHTRSLNHSHLQFSNDDAHWDIEDDFDSTGSRKRARHSGERRSDHERLRRTRHEREWAQRRRALVRDRDDRDSRSREESTRRQELTPPTDFNLGQAEMQEFDGLLGRRTSTIHEADGKSAAAPSSNTTQRHNNTRSDINEPLIPSFMVELDKAQRAANKGRYDLEDAIAAFDKERSSGNTPAPQSDEPVIEILDDEETAREKADVQRRVQRYINENEEFFAPTDEELTKGAAEGKRRIEECEESEKAEKQRIWEAVLKEVEANPPQVEERTYSKHEWPESEHIRPYLKARLAALPIEITQKCTLETLTANINNLAARPPIPSRTITNSVVIKDVNNETLLVKVNTGIEEVFTRTPMYSIKGPMHSHILAAMDRLEAHGVHPPKPRNSDARHSSDRYTIAKEYWETKKQPCGVFYFACWRPLGAYRGHFSSIAGPYGHVLSRDILGEGAWDFGIRARYLANMAPVHQAISLWFETIDNTRYQDYRALVDKLAEADTGLDVVKYAHTQSFLALATLRNMQARNHKDRTNVTDGWAGMTCVGAFTGGELCLPDLDLNITFLPGDVIFFRSSLLEHFVRKFVGMRSSLIFFSQTDPKIPLTQNARFIEPGSEDWERIAAHRAAEIAEESRRAEKLKEFQGLEPYPTKASDLSPYKLQMARRRKLRFVGFARTEAEKGEGFRKVGWDEVRRLEGLEDARFYELNLVELNRWKRGCYPFAKLSEEERRREKRRRERERGRIRRGG